MPCRTLAGSLALAGLLIAGSAAPGVSAGGAAPVPSTGGRTGPQAGWPDFRGPWGNGHVAAAGDARPVGLPLRWSETQNVKWKTPIPHRGWSTPVVLGGQVWLTTATLDGRDFFAVCVDARTGQVRSSEKVFHADDPEPLGNNVNCYASPSPVIEAGRVYVHFRSYGTACLDTATGKVLWERRDLPCRHFRGPGSSPVLLEDLLVLTFDGVDVQYLAALDKKTGRTVWRTDRSTAWDDLDAQGRPIREGDYRKAFSPPLVMDAGGRRQLISPGSKAAYGYDPRTGRELWKVRHTAHAAVLRPVFGCGLVVFCTGLGKPELWAVRPDGRGDVTNTHVAWKAEAGAPKTPSPVIVDDLLYAVGDDGAVLCLEAATGKQVWKERIGGNYAASPLYADGRIYFFNQQGKATVLKAGRAFEVLATNALTGRIHGLAGGLGQRPHPEDQDAPVPDRGGPGRRKMNRRPGPRAAPRAPPPVYSRGACFARCAFRLSALRPAPIIRPRRRDGGTQGQREEGRPWFSRVFGPVPLARAWRADSQKGTSWPRR